VAPGEWLKVNLSADLPIRGLETNGVVKDGRLTLQNADARLMVPEMRDGALRVRVRQGAKALRFSVRSHEGAGLTVVLDGVKLTVIAPNGSPYGGTYGNRPLNIPADGSEILIQFAHYGGSYVVCLGDTNVASGSIAITPPTGTPALHADAAEITGLEVMSLDGVPKDRWPAFALARERMFVPTVPSAASARPGAD